MTPPTDKKQIAQPRRRIVLVMQYYDPEPVYKGQEFAEAIAATGFEVEVVTGFPNYPGGRLYNGYKMRPWTKEEISGIRITRLALYPSHDKGKLGRILNYVSFFLSSSIYLTFGCKRPDVIYAYHPPVTVGLAAAIGAFFRNAPLVVDIHDLWPDTLPATGMISNKRLLGWISKACNWLYRRADHIILHSHGFRKTLEQRNVQKDKLTTVIGWTHEGQAELLEAPPPLSMANLPGLKILFAGNMGPAQALESVLKAAQILSEQGYEDKVTFCLLGSGVDSERLKAKATSLKLTNVVFLPRVLPQQVGAYFAAADCLLVHLKDDPLFATTMPSKTQAYMLAGKPILMAVGGEAADLIVSTGSGLSAIPQNPQSIADTAMAFAAMSAEDRNRMGQSARIYYWQHLCMEKGVAKFSAIFERLAPHAR